MNTTIQKARQHIFNQHLFENKFQYHRKYGPLIEKYGRTADSLLYAMPSEITPESLVADGMDQVQAEFCFFLAKYRNDLNLAAHHDLRQSSLFQHAYYDIAEWVFDNKYDHFIKDANDTIKFVNDVINDLQVNIQKSTSEKLNEKEMLSDIEKLRESLASLKVELQKRDPKPLDILDETFANLKKELNLEEEPNLEEERQDNRDKNEKAFLGTLNTLIGKLKKDQQENNTSHTKEIDHIAKATTRMITDFLALKATDLNEQQVNQLFKSYYKSCNPSFFSKELLGLVAAIAVTGAAALLGGGLGLIFGGPLGLFIGGGASGLAAAVISAHVTKGDNSSKFFKERLRDIQDVEEAGKELFSPKPS